MTALTAAIVGLTSCNGGDAKLAGELSGTWKGNTTGMMNGKKDKLDKDSKRNRGEIDGARRDDSGEMTCTPTFTFVRTENANGGTLNISVVYTVIRSVESVTTTTPIKATVNGNVNASGTWTVKDDDEVVVNLDPSKTTVNVDTASLSLSYANLTDAPQDSLNTIKDRVAANISDVIKPMLAGRIQRIREFDDVKIKGNTMELEVDHRKMIFTKQ